MATTARMAALEAMTTGELEALVESRTTDIDILMKNAAALEQEANEARRTAHEYVMEKSFARVVLRRKENLA